MADFVDSKEQVLVGCRTDNIGGQEEGPGEYRRIAQQVCTDDLKQNDSGNDIFREGLWTAEFQDLCCGCG